VEFDVIVRGGTLFDGEGGPGRLVDLGIRADRVAAVEDLQAASAGLEVDATGLAVSPGFIDTHTHSDGAWCLGPEHTDLVAASVRQGVTTEVCGNCGFSPFPLLAERKPELVRHMSTLLGSRDPEWHDLAGFTAAAETAGLVANLAPLVGHGTLRACVLGLEDRPPTGDELAGMKRLLAVALEQGAFGLSSGLIYAPGVYAATEELVELARVVAAWKRPYTSHIRGETDMVADSVREAIRIGREAGLPAHISHHKAAGRQNWGRTEETLGMIDQARREGSDVSLDVYPYTAGSTMLQALLPPWAQAGGPDAMLERLTDAETRRRIVAQWESGSPGWENLQRAAGWDGIVISSCPGATETEGRTIEELASDAGKPETTYLFDLLVEQRARATMIMHVMSEADVSRVVAYQGATIGSDGIPLPGKPHPRWAGSFARVLGRYSREGGLDLATLIQRMTGLAAQRFGLRERGRLVPGKVADVVVFDPATVADRATYDQPLLAPTGISHVLVNGRSVVASGELTARRPGRVLTPA
jgi:dihydroorotase/N-acyl-D-amino-acid deacylase